MKKNKEYLDTAEMLEFLGISRATSYNWRLSGKLKTYRSKKGMKNLFKLKDLKELVKELNGVELLTYSKGKYENKKRRDSNKERANSIPKSIT